jgi:hypothetical protein
MSRVRDLVDLNYSTTNVTNGNFNTEGNIGFDGNTPAVSLDIGGRTDAILVPKGTTAQRPSSPVTGMIRYNIQLEHYELYDSVAGWIKINDAPPAIASISPTHISTTEVASTQSITITGNGFDSGTYVRLVPANGNTDIVPVSTTLVSGTELSITVNTSDLDSAEEPYDVRVVKASGLGVIAQNVLYVDNKPVWSITPNETIKTVHAIFRSAVDIQLPTAIDPDGDVVTYAATNLPSGLALNSTTGLISGSLANVSSDTTYSPTVKAFSTGSDPGATQIETTRTVNIVQKAGIENSLRFDGTSYLSRTPTTTTGSSSTTFTYSCWVKKSVNSSSGNQNIFEAKLDGNDYLVMYFQPSDEINIHSYHTSKTGEIISTAKYRDNSSWYHLIFVCDTTNSTGDDRYKLFVNGERVSDLSSNIPPAPNYSTYVNTLNQHRIGNGQAPGQVFYGYLANIQFIDGQALSASDFGEPVNGIWTPKTYSGTYGTNGFWLRFDSKNAIESDVVGGNNGTNYGVTLVYDADYGDNVAKFDGSQYIAIPSTATTYYISAWIYYDGTDTTGVINRTVYHNTWWKGFDLFLSNGKAKIQLYNESPPGNSELASTGSLVIGWNHVYFEVTISAHKLVLNNGAVDTNSHTISWAGSSTLHFGKRLLHSVYTSYYTGKLANIKLFSSPLSASEITSLYNKEEITNGLIAHYPLNDDLGKDSSGNGNHWQAN